MGGIPSRDAPPNFFSLRYGTHEVGLIPLIRRYFHKENIELRRQFVSMRNDPSVRYNFMRPPEYTMKQLPPATYTEEDLDRFLNVTEGLLYDTMEEMLADEDAPLRPLPCAVCFIYVNGREGADCMSFYGRRINIIGQFGCHRYEDKPDDEPGLFLRKVILKAAGDRTLERVVTIAAKVIQETFFRAVSKVRPEADAATMFERRISRSFLITATPWNSYPALKFLHDTVVLAWGVGNVESPETAPKFTTYGAGEGGESGLVMEMSGPLLFRSITWMCGTLVPSVVRASWEQFLLNEVVLQKKDKSLLAWTSTSPHVVRIFGSEEITRRVQTHLKDLLSEVVRARETPSDDLTLWCAEQECSSDGKVYRIFDSPLCGPFLTTVKTRRDKKSDTSSDPGSNPNSSGHHHPHHPESLIIVGHNEKKMTCANVKRRGGRNVGTCPNIPRSPPRYQDAVQNVLPPSYIPSSSQSACFMSTSTVQHTAAPFSMQLSPMMMTQMPPSAVQNSLTGSSGSPQIVPTFLPVYQDTPTPAPIPMQQVLMPYVVFNSPGHTIQQQQHHHHHHLHHSHHQQRQSFVAVNQNAMSSDTAATTTSVCVDGGGSATAPAQFAAPQPPAVVSVAGGGGGAALDSAVYVPPLSNYVLLPDGCIGLLNSTHVSPLGYWNK